jgi:hypothetical protein
LEAKINVNYQRLLFTNECTNNIKIYIKIAPICFGVVTPFSGSALSVLAKVTLAKIANYGTLVDGNRYELSSVIVLSQGVAPLPL